jgi:hypothetical protein
VAAGRPVIVHVTAEGIADIAAVELLINGEGATLDRFGRTTYTTSEPGRVALSASATDVDGVLGAATAAIKVRDPDDAAAPNVILHAPAAGSVLSVARDVVITVDDVNLDTYTLALAPLGSHNFGVLAAGTDTVSAGAVAELDPETLSNGAYVLRLEARDMSGRRARVERQIEINSATKTAAFTTTVTDLSTTIDGVPFELKRFYSSLDSDADGAFGSGWQLLGFEPRVATNLPPTGEEADGVYSAFRDATRVYLNLPNGQRAGFTFTPARHEHGGSVWYSPGWTPDAGVTYQLASADAALEKVGKLYQQRRTGLPYNPASGARGCPTTQQAAGSPDLTTSWSPRTAPSTMSTRPTAWKPS